MSYRIELAPRARAKIKALPGRVRRRALEILDALAAKPRPSRARELHRRPDIYRLWLARRWRIAYLIDRERERVVILRLRSNERIAFDDLPSWLGEGERATGFGTGAPAENRGDV